MISLRENQRAGLGATFSIRKTSFRVWAPYFRKVEVEIRGVNNNKTTHALDDEERGYHSLLVDDVPAGADYFFVLEGKKKRADPASKFQPQGVHGVSRVVDPSAFKWSDAKWKGIRKEDLIIYELHVGTYSTQGTFEAIIPHLDYPKNTLGVTAVELMPVGQFPGDPKD
jgi:maltooligosyltrehalose trehalohydrolase